MRDNNFDFLRFLFAIFVIISHSYPLSVKDGNEEWLLSVTNGQTSWSSIGLAGFFTISGYLIYQSLQRSKSLWSYLWKRLLRLFPALIIVLLLTVLMGPIVYESDISYLKNRSVYHYFFRNISLYNLQYHISGVFQNNPYPNAINGSLWTLCYEFTMYIFIALFFFIKYKTKVIKYILVVLGLAMIVGFSFYMDHLKELRVLGMYGESFLDLCTFFIIGSLMAVYKIETVKHKRSFLLFTLLIVMTAFYFDSFSYIKHVFLALLVLFIGLIPIPYFKDFGKYGDPSYGIYIYAFPVQQTLMYYFKYDSLNLMLYSILISVPLGYLSWYIVEKKALMLKNRFV